MIYTCVICKEKCRLNIDNASIHFNDKEIIVCKKCQNKYIFFNRNLMPEKLYNKYYEIRISGKLKTLKEGVFVAKLIKNKK